MTPRRALERDPSRFAFDAAIRLLLHEADTADPAEAARFVSPTNLTYPGAEVQAVTPDNGRPKMLTTVMGMTGPSGVLPRGYSEIVTDTIRERSPSLHVFLDMLADRFIAQFAKAGSKYHLHRAAEDAALADRPDPFGRALLALTGYATADMGARLGAGEASLQHYAGFFATRPRSAERLAALASDWLGQPVEVQQFFGSWLELPKAERTALPQGLVRASFTRLDSDASVGIRAWDLQACLILVIGPLNRLDFEMLMPNKARIRWFASLVRVFLGMEVGFSIKLVLQHDELHPLQLTISGEIEPRLGWNTWLTADASSRLFDLDEPLFNSYCLEPLSEPL